MQTTSFTLSQNGLTGRAPASAESLEAVKRRLFLQQQRSPTSIIRANPFDPIYVPAGPKKEPSFREEYDIKYGPGSFERDTQKFKQRSSFDPPLSAREFYKSRSIQLHHAYERSRRENAELARDNKELRNRIAALEDQVLRLHGKVPTSPISQDAEDDAKSESSKSTQKAVGSAVAAGRAPEEEDDEDDIPEPTTEEELLRSAALAVTTEDPDDHEDDEPQPAVTQLPEVVTVRAKDSVNLFFTDSEALSDTEDDLDFLHIDDPELSGHSDSTVAPQKLSPPRRAGHKRAAPVPSPRRFLNQRTTIAPASPQQKESKVATASTKEASAAPTEHVASASPPTKKAKLDDATPSAPEEEAKPQATE